MPSSVLLPIPVLKMVKMSCWLFILSLNCILNSYPVALCAQNNTSLFDAYMNGQTELYGFNGNVLVSKNGNVIYTKSFGFADYNTKKELEDNSVFDCGSIAKEFTAMGMIITSTGDLLKWDRALKNHSLLTETTQREMLSQQSEKTFPKVSFGYGMIVGKNDFGNYIFHIGYYPGYKSMHIRYTDVVVTVIVLSNNESPSDFIADGLSAIVLNKNIILPYVHKETIRSVGSDKYGGKYMMQLTRPPYMAVFPIEFVKRNDTLYVHPGNGPDIMLKPESENFYFFADGTDQQIEFETANNGSPSRVWHIAWGVKKELKKMK